MPYIDSKRREAIAPDMVGTIKGCNIQTVGELNYAITQLMVQFIQNNGGKSYTNFAMARIACHDAAEEIYRRIVGKYEDGKAKEHGDVYGALETWFLLKKKANLWNANSTLNV